MSIMCPTELGMCWSDDPISVRSVAPDRKEFDQKGHLGRDWFILWRSGAQCGLAPCICARAVRGSAKNKSLLIEWMIKSVPLLIKEDGIVFTNSKCFVSTVYLMVHYKDIKPEDVQIIIYNKDDTI